VLCLIPCTECHSIRYWNFPRLANNLNSVSIPNFTLARFVSRPADLTTGGRRPRHSISELWIRSWYWPGLECFPGSKQLYLLYDLEMEKKRRDETSGDRGKMFSKCTAFRSHAFWLCDKTSIGLSQASWVYPSCKGVYAWLYWYTNYTYINERRSSVLCTGVWLLPLLLYGRRHHIKRVF
jgi:hypothetical protein